MVTINADSGTVSFGEKKKRPAKKKKAPEPKALKTGAMVRIRKGAHVFGTTRLFEKDVYLEEYKVLEIKGNKVTLMTKDEASVIGSVTRSECDLV